MVALFLYSSDCARIWNYVILIQNDFNLELKDSMKCVRFIFGIMLFFSSTSSMELSPRQSPNLKLGVIQEIEKIFSIINLVEAETNYANPHAAKRITAAGKQLFLLSNKKVLSKLPKLFPYTQALSNAKIMHERSAQTVAKYWASPLADSSVMLLEQAYLIALAVEELNKNLAIKTQQSLEQLS